ncbi:hypothetical protein [Aquincola agrisoli]|uniref:hypothetical protein n=1 Tax=Aquincola TaxID=391952 RepID=UPI00366D494E
MLLPLQISWAAVAAYCEHEAHAAPGHDLQFDGYEHAQPSDGDASGEAGHDCGHCHGHGSAMLPRAPDASGVPAHAHPPAAPDGRAAAHAPPRPERPQWPTLA